MLYETLTLYPPFRATDMNALYKKVIKGVYEDPPATYSRDIKRLINSMLMVKSDLRPSCEQIINCREFQKAVKTYNLDVSVVKEFYQPQDAKKSDGEAQNTSRKPELLKTIQLPKNLKHLQRNLPKPMYDLEEETKESTFKKEHKRRIDDRPTALDLQKQDTDKPLSTAKK